MVSSVFQEKQNKTVSFEIPSCRRRCSNDTTCCCSTWRVKHIMFCCFEYFLSWWQENSRLREQVMRLSSPAVGLLFLVISTPSNTSQKEKVEFHSFCIGVCFRKDALVCTGLYVKETISFGGWIYVSFGSFRIPPRIVVPAERRVRAAGMCQKPVAANFKIAPSGL